MTLIINREFRDRVLQILSDLYSAQSEPDYTYITRCWIFLNQSSNPPKLLRELLNAGKFALAYQVAFDLYNNATQQFLKICIDELAADAAAAPAVTAEGEGAAADAADATGGVDPVVMQRVTDILCVTSRLYLFDRPLYVLPSPSAVLLS